MKDTDVATGAAPPAGIQERFHAAARRGHASLRGRAAGTSGTQCEKPGADP
jgi:hypothetical protein